MDSADTPCSDGVPPYHTIQMRLRKRGHVKVVVAIVKMHRQSLQQQLIQPPQQDIWATKNFEEY